MLFGVAHLSEAPDSSSLSRISDSLQIRFCYQLAAIFRALPAGLALKVNLRLVLIIHHFCFNIVRICLTVIVLLGQIPIRPAFSDGKTKINGGDYCQEKESKACRNVKQDSSNL